MAIGSYSDALGFMAALLTLATFVQTAMVPMRVSAIGANMCFVGFGALADCYPVLALHVILLPVNAYRLWTASREGALPARSCFGRATQGDKDDATYSLRVMAK